jgi:tetratricopeptide (TPR) repeat protein
MPEGVEDEEVRQALEDARQVVMSQPDSADAWGNLAKVLLAHLYDRDADVCFAQAAALDPHDACWLYARGLIASKRNPDKAPPLLRQALTAAVCTPEYRSAACLLLAETLLERGHLAEAEELYGEEQVRDPMSARAALGLGQIALARGESSVAAKFLLRARDSDFARKIASSHLAAAARASGDLKAAAAHDKEAALARGDRAWPDPLLDEILHLEVGLRGRERRVTRLEVQHRYAEAAQIHLHQLETKPTMQDYLGAGLNLCRLRDYNRGLPLLREAVRLAPDSANAEYTLALALYSRAERDWQNSPGADQLKQWFREAVQHARRATALRPDHAKAYLFWGLSLKYLGDFKAAIAPLQKGIACNPADFELQYGLGEVLMETGRGAEAEKCLDDAHRLTPNDPRPVRALERLRQSR